MEFVCSVCNYTSPNKQHVVRHMNRKNKCTGNNSTREILEVNTSIVCKYCNKNFSTKKTLSFHCKYKCHNKDLFQEDRIKKLEDRVSKLESISRNNKTVSIIIVNNYEDTSLDKITDTMYNKIIVDSDGIHKIIPMFINNLHFNPNIPENHNIYVSNRSRSNKYLNILRNGKWEITDKNAEIFNLISDKETNLHDWVIEKGKKYPQAVEIFNEYLERKYEDDINKLIIKEVEVTLYNGKHLIKCSPY